MSHFDDTQLYRAAKQILMVFYNSFYKPSAREWLEEKELETLAPTLDENLIDQSMSLLLERNFIHITKAPKLVSNSEQAYKITADGIEHIDSNRAF